MRQTRSSKEKSMFNVITPCVIRSDLNLMLTAQSHKHRPPLKMQTCLEVPFVNRFRDVFVSSAICVLRSSCLCQMLLSKSQSKLDGTTLNTFLTTATFTSCFAPGSRLSYPGVQSAFRTRVGGVRGPGGAVGLWVTGLTCLHSSLDTEQ